MKLKEQKTNWKYPQMGEVCNFIGGSQPPKSEFIFEPKEGYVRLLQIRDYKSDKNITYISQQKARRFCSKDDIMIGRYGPPLFQILRGLEGAYNVALMKASPKNANILDREYLYYFLKNERLFNYVVSNSERTAGQDGVKKELLETYQIPLPPLEEQKRIAAILDKADAIRRKRKEAIALTEELLRSTFLDMFGDPVTNPKGWKVVKFEEIFESIRYGTSTPPIFEDKGIPFVRATNIKNGTIVTNDLRFISSVEARKIEKCKLKYGDIVIVRSGVNSGDSAFISKEYENAYAGYDMIIDISPSLSIFYNYLINDNSGKQMIEPLTRRAGQPHLNADQVRNLEFILPPQNLIIDFNEVFDIYNLEKQKLDISLGYLDNLFNSLLQKAFRGEL
ncbi:MAG: restriction endonuclease subunit S [Pleurocapsa minor HA4230-MV1]|jgi:type I restriction enzyme S subunit|nr:restriction endonuclease subunit S [Pleurocapsa minor HA4230-MV1]